MFCYFSMYPEEEKTGFIVLCSPRFCTFSFLCMPHYVPRVCVCECVSVCACYAGYGWSGLLLSSHTFQESGGRRSPEMTLQIQLLAFHLLLTATWLDTGHAFLCLGPDVVLTHFNMPTVHGDHLQRWPLKSWNNLLL